jgi:hypothetical protein
MMEAVRVAPRPLASISAYLSQSTPTPAPARSPTKIFRSERFVKSFSFLQVKILPQKEVS